MYIRRNYVSGTCTMRRRDCGEVHAIEALRNQCEAHYQAYSRARGEVLRLMRGTHCKAPRLSPASTLLAKRQDWHEMSTTRRKDWHEHLSPGWLILKSRGPHGACTLRGAETGTGCTLLLTTQQQV